MANSIVDRFARLKALQPTPRKRPVQEPCESRAASSGFTTVVPEGSRRLAQILEARTVSNTHGEHLALRRWFSEPAECNPDAAALRLLAPEAPEEVADPRKWLFLDTETTGIMGGTGTYAFLVGIAWWDAGGFEVEQFFMRDHSEEHSVLAALAERMAERPVLVTFNGKSFDWPLLETRYRMTRSIRPPAFRAHLDFLHPARNLWRLRIGSVRLAELERHILGWKREGDVNSQMIPQFYFDFLRGDSPEPLVSVFYHNQMDLRGLAGLSVRVLSLLADPGAGETTALELFGVSRICERRGESTRARKLYERSLAGELPPATDRAARHSLALLAKREGDFSLAAKLWESILGNSREGFEAYEQLAIHFERRMHEPHRAAATARAALSELRRASKLGTIATAEYCRRRMRFESRLARLERKAGRSLLDTVDAESRRTLPESNPQR
ncbi:MAG: ribonuclease H-like domain-containing protein [Candidatus Acidiferrales bacterium]